MKIIFPDKKIEQTASSGDTLLDVIRAAGMSIEALCDGRGTCGKCRVRANGLEKLACRTPAEDGMTVEILSNSEGQEILTDSRMNHLAGKQTGTGNSAIAIDIGTTTVVLKAVDTGSGEELSVRAFTNPQRVYGADVLSRINESMDDASLLSGLIREALDDAISDIANDCFIEAKGGSPRNGIEKIVIAGNTTMMYLLLGLRCRSIGLAPFTPEFELKPVYTYSEVFGSETLSCPVLIYPYISAYVGGDIVSGLVNIERHIETGASPSYILVDMGTNGEIAYRNGDRLITTSTAAGPALEGGNISCGMSGLPGAIFDAVCDAEGNFSYQTIGGRPPLGICGSGVISLMAALLDAGLVSETGAFSEAGDKLALEKCLVIAEGGGGAARVIFTQKDVREFQLAKGAIRAGIDILISEMGEPPAALYLAGGFGININLEAAFRVGLIPRELFGRVFFAGNTSLGGCIDACVSGGFGTVLSAQEINLGSHKDFNNKFMETMLFE